MLFLCVTTNMTEYWKAQTDLFSVDLGLEVNCQNEK